VAAMPEKFFRGRDKLSRNGWVPMPPANTLGGGKESDKSPVSGVIKTPRSRKMTCSKNRGAVNWRGGSRGEGG